MIDVLAVRFPMMLGGSVKEFHDLLCLLYLSSYKQLHGYTHRYIGFLNLSYANEVLFSRVLNIF